MSGIDCCLFKAFVDYKTVYDASVSYTSDPVEEPESASYGEGENAVAANAEEYYAIQIMGLGRLLADTDPALKGLKTRAVKSDGSNIYKYVYGSYASKEDAAAQLPSVRKKFPEAFVVFVKGAEVSRVK